MADIDVDGLRRLAEAATPGPWHVEEAPWDIGGAGGIPGCSDVDRIVCGPEPKGVPRDGIAEVFDGYWLRGEQEPGAAPNLHYIAAMDPPTTLALLAEVTALRGQVAAVRAAAFRAMDLANMPVAQLILAALGGPT